MEILPKIGSLLIGALQAGFDLFTALAGEVSLRFGQSGLLAFYIVIISVSVVVLWKAVSLLFAIIRYLILPTVILAWIGSMIFPYPFTTLLPVSAAGCSLILLYKA